VQKIILWSATAGLAATLTGCSLLSASGPAKASPVGPNVVFTRDASPSVLIVVLNGPGSGTALAGLVGATVQPREDLEVLQAGTPPETVLSSSSPAAPAVVVAGKPQPPTGETSYLAAQYAGRLAHWRALVAAGQQAEVAEVHQVLSTWLTRLQLPTRIGRLTDPPGPAGGLMAESATASSALDGLAEEDDSAFGDRRVVLLYTDDLTGRPPAGELAGDTVFVVTPFLPTAAASSAVQADLLAAGAAAVAVVGPEVTAARFAALVSAALGHEGIAEYVSPAVLFSSNSAALGRASTASLAALLPQLRAAGVTAVINGFASTPGAAPANYTLSYNRAAAVAAYFEAHGVSASSLVIVGHGATDLVAPGGSGSNRRVTIVVEKSS
jgi:outer membrane protein OmpA-like peptidoglycan-associated protein